MKSAAELILELRKREGLSQEAFAKKLGYASKSTINKIEKGINDISYEKLVKLIELSKTLFDKYCALDRKKRISVIAGSVLVFLILWAFIGASIITCNFNRSQVKNAQDEQKVDAAGIIITETKEGTKFFEIYGELITESGY